MTFQTENKRTVSAPGFFLKFFFSQPQKWKKVKKWATSLTP